MPLPSLQERAEMLAQRASQDQALEDEPRQDQPRQSWVPTINAEHPNPLTAVVTGFSEGKTDYGTKRIMNVRDLSQKDWSVWLIHHGLLTAIEEKDPQPGQLVFLHYQGKKPSKSNPDREFYVYNVCVEPPTTRRDPDPQAFNVSEPANTSDDDIPF